MSLQSDPEAGTAEWRELFDAAVAEYELSRASQAEAAQPPSRRRRRRPIWRKETETPVVEVVAQKPVVDARMQERMHTLMLKAARSGIKPEYKFENVLADAQQTFGIEIEFEGCGGDAVAGALYDAGLTVSPDQQQYHSYRRGDKWTVERDGSVRGGEVVSPILTDTPEIWREIQTVCETIKGLGGKTNAYTGGHIHIGTTTRHDREKSRRVAEICTWAEDLLFRVAANTDGRRLAGSLSRNGTLKHRGAVIGYQWCRPLQSLSPEQQLLLPIDHDSAVNFRGTTIEFRHFDATIDPVRLQNNIKLAAAIVDKAAGLAEGAEIPRERNPLGKHRFRGDPQDRLLREFATFLFADPRDQLGLYSLYVASRWQPGPRQIPRAPVRRMAREVAHVWELR